MKSAGLKASQAHEARLAGKYGGQVSAASGAFWGRKGDVRTDDVLFEHKYTAKSSFSLSRAVLDKIEREAVLDSRMPVLAVHLGGKDYIVLREDDFREMMEAVGCDPETMSGGNNQGAEE